MYGMEMHLEGPSIKYFLGNCVAVGGRCGGNILLKFSP